MTLDQVVVTGTPNAQAKRELGKPVFTSIEKLIFAAVVAGALVAAYGLYDGFLTL